ncbi:MAG: hypothetical protein GC191_10680 [Azospirillum sp.]|nr:hypothetical protein [Azospirillum sp.]
MTTAAAAALALLCAAAPASAENPKIDTGGAAGSYHKSFGPLLKDALRKSLFNYDLATSAGSGENIARVAASPSDIGLVQFDVFALKAATEPALTKSVTVIRSDVAHECLFAVAQKDVGETLKNWGGIKSVANRLRIATGPKDSGSAITLDYLRSIDADLAKATIANFESVDAAVDAVAAGQAHLAFFVQFADTTNERFKTINKKHLSFLAVADRDMLRQKVGDDQVYVPQEVKVSSAMLTTWTGVAKIVTMCTPIAYITGNPEGLSGKPQADQKDLIDTVRKLDADALRPKESWYRQIVDSAAVMSQSGLEQTLKAMDEAKASVTSMAANIKLPELPAMPSIPGLTK